MGTIAEVIAPCRTCVFCFQQELGQRATGSFAPPDAILEDLKDFFAAAPVVNTVSHFEHKMSAKGDSRGLLTRLGEGP